MPEGQSDELWRRRAASFGSSAAEYAEHRPRRTAESLTATIGTHSHTRVVPPAEREETLARIRAFLDARPETSAGEFDVPMTTAVHRAARS